MSENYGSRNFIPGFLIVIGVIILIRNWWIGIYSINPDPDGFYNYNFWMFWPLILVVIGILIVIQHRSQTRNQDRG